ncbi:MAG: cation diffusion facilitator family transporter [Candidatus Dormibacterales bacterium]
MGRLTRRPELVALASLLVGVAIVAAKLAAGLLTGSLGLVVEALHSGIDAVSSALAYGAVKTARKPPDREHPYGHGRAENLAAFGEGVLLLVTALAIAYAAVGRLAAGRHGVTNTEVGVWVLVATIGVESVRAEVLRRAGRAAHSQALEASFQNRLTDVLTSLGVLAGLVGVGAGYWWADSAAALAVAGIVLRSAAAICWRAGDILMDRAPAGAEEDLRRTIGAVPGVREIRSVRVRRSGPRLLGDARVAARRTLSVEGAQSLSSSVREAVATALPEMDLTLVVEAHPRLDDLVERVHAAAARHGEVRDLHNVTVERERDGSLHLTMHAKLPPAMSLEAASVASAALERYLRGELPEISRVDVHLEPMEPELVAGEDVTRRQAALAAAIRSLVEDHPEVTACRDVELSNREGAITAHVVAEMPGEVSLEHAHSVETELQETLRSHLPALHEVVARVQPGRPGPGAGA